MGWRGRMRRLGSILAMLAIVLICGGLALWLETPNIADTVRPVIVRQIKSMIGRDLTIGGDITVTRSLTPTVVAHQVTFRNSPWGSDRPMLEVRALKIKLRLVPLVVHREIVIDQLILSDASLLIEQNVNGTLNWQSVSAAEPTQAESRTGRAPPYIANLKIEKSLVVWHDMSDDTRKTIHVDTLTWTAKSAAAPLQMSAMGTIDDMRLQFAGQVGPFAQLLGGKGKWGVDLTGRIQEAAITARGTVDLDGEATDLALTARGEHVEALGSLLDIKLPVLGTYEAEGRLIGAIATPTLERASARIGDPTTAELRVKEGRVGNLGHFRDVKLPFTLRADNLKRAGRMIGLTLPPLKPLSGEAVLMRKSKGYALEKISVRAGTVATQVNVTGSLGDVFARPDAKLEVSANANSVNALGDFVGKELGLMGPLRLSARLSGRSPNLQIANLSAELDKSDVQGTLTVDLDASPTALRGDLASRRLDLQSLLGRGSALADGNKLPFVALSDAELHIRLKADTVILANSTIGPASAQVDLKDGRLALSDVEVKMLGGTISSSAVMTAKDGTSRSGALAFLDLRLRAYKLDLSKLLTEAVTAPGDNLQVDVDVVVDSNGRTPDQLLANLSGEARVFSGGGKILGSGLNRLILDVNPLRLLPPFWGSADVVNIKCLAGTADIKQGIADTYVMLDTQQMIVLGEGTINLGEKQINLTLDPSPKSSRLAVTGVPVLISGPLGSPTVTPRAKEAVGGLLKGLLGHLAMPLNQIARTFGERARDACASAVPR
jgi:uncharacterized protein involved in outer membrane biogenesis